MEWKETKGLLIPIGILFIGIFSACHAPANNTGSGIPGVPQAETENVEESSIPDVLPSEPGNVETSGIPDVPPSESGNVETLLPCPDGMIQRPGSDECLFDRFFQETSTWYRSIPDAPALLASSDANVDDIAISAWADEICGTQAVQDFCGTYTPSQNGNAYFDQCSKPELLEGCRQEALAACPYYAHISSCLDAAGKPVEACLNCLSNFINFKCVGPKLLEMINSCVDETRNDASIHKVVYPFLINNSTVWSVPIFHASHDTPLQKVPVTGGSCQGAVGEGWDLVPIPPEAVPAGYAEQLKGISVDGHMSIVSADRHFVWDFYGAKRNADGAWSAVCVRRWDLDGDGINSPYDGKGTVRAAPVPLLSGLITYDEVVLRGRIDHALHFFYNGGTSTYQMGRYPAEIATGHPPTLGVTRYREGGLVIGTRLQLKPDAFDCDDPANSLLTGDRVVCRSLKEYGVIFVDIGGGAGVYAESLAHDPQNRSWEEIFTQLPSGQIAIPGLAWDMFRAVEPLE